MKIVRLIAFCGWLAMFITAGALAHHAYHEKSVPFGVVSVVLAFALLKLSFSDGRFIFFT